MKFWALSAIPHSYIALEYSNLYHYYPNIIYHWQAEDDNFKDKLEAQQIEMTWAKVTQWRLAEPH